jgi:hypothetical protein
VQGMLRAQACLLDDKAALEDRVLQLEGQFAM